ncbi:nucleoside triphosphate pyrophosphohydrolase ham1 [Varicellaria rhodocarpa]|nr:nucleoside triphosphate pyrophosphohydrolase ham1 [Varicellaria rhodocarpa]
MAPRELLFITGNRNKLAEVSFMLGDMVHLSSRSLDLTEIQGTIEEISVDKCTRAALAVNGPVLVEDTCLCFDALKGLPGPYMNNSKWFLEELGHQGLNNLLSAYEDKSAEAVCTFAYSAGPNHKPVIFQGRTNGKIVPARGPSTFGWDAVFECEGKTFAEMDKVEKNKISHRFKALEKLKEWLESSN